MTFRVAGTFLAIVALLFVGIATCTALAVPEFDVTSVKVNQTQTGPSVIFANDPGRFVASNTPLRFVILYAYELLDHQLIGAPEWTSSISFNITATYQPGGGVGENEVHAMVRKLLADRFGLTVHHEDKEVPVYALVLARKDGRLGPQMRQSDVDCQKWIAEKRPQADTGGPSAVSPSGKRPACMMIATRRYLTGGTRSMGQLATTLQSLTGRPIVDRTGLTGAYDIDLKWTNSEVGSLAGGTGGGAVENDGPSIFTAIQEQLGLRLSPDKGRVDVVVIDQISHPSAN